MASKPGRFSILPNWKICHGDEEKTIIMAAEMVVLTKEQFSEILDEKVSSIVADCFEKFLGSQKNAEVPEDRNLPILDLCARWNVSKGTIHNYMKQGLINPMKLGRRVLFPMSEVLRAEANGLTKFKGGR